MEKKALNFDPNDFRDSIGLCQNCAAIFKIGKVKIQVKNIHPMFDGPIELDFSGSCPACGFPDIKTANVLHEFIEDAFSYAKTLKLPDLIKLRKALKKYCEGDRSYASKKELDEVIISLAPKVFNIKSFVPKTSSDLAAWIGLLLTVFSLTIQQIQNNKTEKTTIILNNVGNTNIVAPQIVNDTTKKVVGRNDICPCGSGKKFKKCHGFN